MKKTAAPPPAPPVSRPAPLVRQMPLQQYIAMLAPGQAGLSPKQAKVKAIEKTGLQFGVSQ